MFGFRHGIATMDCLAYFSSHIYHTFCIHTFMATTFLCIKSAYGSVSYTHYLFLTMSRFCSFVSQLFRYRKLVFNSPFGTSVHRVSHQTLPQVVL